MMQSKKREKEKIHPDRRVFARLPVKLPLKFLEIGEKKESKAQTLDVCANGIGFISKTKLEPDTLLEIWMDMPESGEPLYITGKVVWCNSIEGEPEQWRVGVSFERVNLISLGQIFYRKKETTQGNNEQKNKNISV